MKKIIFFICLSIFICISIIKPIDIYAYDLTNYVSTDMTAENFSDTTIGSIIAGLLESGGSMYIPAGITTDEFYDDIADILYDTMNKDIIDSAWDYYMRHPGLSFDPLPTYMWSTPESDTPNFVKMGLDVLLNSWEDQNQTTPEFPPDYSFVNYSKDFVLLYSDHQGSTTFIEDNVPISYSYWPQEGILNFDKTQYTYFLDFNGRDSFFDGTEYYKISNICTMYVSGNDTDGWIVTMTGFSNPNYWPLTNPIQYMSKFKGFTLEDNVSVFNFWDTSDYTNPYPYTFDTLEDALIDICISFRHFNLYVNNTPWVIVDPSDALQIGGQTYITNTNTPIHFNYPNGTYFNPNTLKSILRQLIDGNSNLTGIQISLDDILDAFTDVNGVTAVYTINVVRNDYDNLIFEQYGNNRLTQSKGLIFPKDDLVPYTETSTYITQSSIELIPSDILTILCGCGVLILIAFLINRLLE